VIHFVYKSGFLSRDWRAVLEYACPFTKQYAILRRKYSRIDFTPLRNFLDPAWETITTIPDETVDMFTACFFHYDFDTATVVRYIGGQYIGNHRPTEEILGKLLGIIDDDVWSDRYHCASKKYEAAPLNPQDSPSDSIILYTIQYDSIIS